jgi:hypothetical protein
MDLGGDAVPHPAWRRRPILQRLRPALAVAVIPAVEGSTRDAEVVMVRENESIYLPLGCVHRLDNPGRIPLTLIEVQSGSYLGEDDIVRLEDTYGRS